jgi:hypothetical protein
MHAVELVEHGFETPEATAAKNSGFELRPGRC